MSGLPNQIIIMEARREYRLHHYLWHQVRNSWMVYQEPTREALRNLGWEPPRPARDRKGNPIHDNDSGEDFLYMHRQMILQVNAKLLEIHDPSYPRIEGWKRVPTPNDIDYPVPPAWDFGDPNVNERIREWKSDDYYRTTLKEWENLYTNENHLSNLTLGQLGSHLEFEIHNRMHMRWAAQPMEARPQVDPARPNSIDTRWDTASYNYLGDTYSSHVNPVFWKIHGWVDDRIEDWKNAHNITEPIQWRGKWVGKMPNHPTTDSLHALLTIGEEQLQHAGTHMDNMLQALDIVQKSGKFYEFYMMSGDF